MNQPSPLASWNGEIMPLTEVRVPVLDRAFLFGDAIYEALRVYEGRPFLVDEHHGPSPAKSGPDPDRSRRRSH